MAENLKNTLLIDDTEYNINAVEADVAKKTQAALIITHSVNGDSTDDSEYFNGSEGRYIKYVPAGGGKFTGPVLIDNKYAVNLEGIDNQAIINYRQINNIISNLTGSSLYTWDNSNQIRYLKDDEGAYYKLNTLIGTSYDLNVFKSILANPNGSRGIIYSYDDASDTYTVDGLDTAIFDADVIIPASYNGKSVTTIKNRAFSGSDLSGNSNIKSVVLPSSITSIGNQAFMNCKNLVSINIPDGVKTIGNSTFSGCSKLKNVRLGSRLTTIGSSAFSQCYNLDNIVIPEGVATIEKLAFNGCTKLASVIIPKSVTTLEYQIFDASNAVPLTIYYTGTETQWSDLTKKHEALTNVRLKTATVVYDYKIPSVGGSIDFENFNTNPFIYICKDDEGVSSIASNKIYLKLPNRTDFIEISKGAARLETPEGATTAGYYTYETLAAIIAGINSRLTALGSTALALPETLKVFKADEENYIEELPLVPASNDIISINDNVIVEETVVPTVQQLQQQLTNITGLNQTADYANKENEPTPVRNATADDDNVNIKTGYYRSINNEFTQDSEGNKNINTIMILNKIPTSGGKVGDICIVIPNE